MAHLNLFRVINAAKDGETEVVREYLKDGGDPNAYIEPKEYMERVPEHRKRYLLTAAIESDNLDTVELLLKAKADLKVVEDPIKTAIQFSTNDNYSIVQLLIERDNYKTPVSVLDNIQYAISAYQFNIAKFLLKHLCDMLISTIKMSEIEYIAKRESEQYRLPPSVTTRNRGKR